MQILTLALAVLNFLYSFKNKRESLRDSNMPKYSIINPHFIEILEIDFQYFSVDIKNVSSILAPFMCIILKFKESNDQTKYFRSGIIPYFENEQRFEFCLPREETIRFDTLFIISKDENGATYVKEYIWQSDKAIFLKNKLFGRKNKKIEKMINSSVEINQNLYPYKQIIELFNIVKELNNHPDYMKQMIIGGPIFKKRNESISRIKQIMDQNPNIFEKK